MIYSVIFKYLTIIPIFAGLFLVQTTEAFFAAHQNLEKISDKVFVKGNDIAAELVHTSTWKNNASQDIAAVFIRPWHENFTEPVLYLDSEGRNLEKFTGPIAREKIFYHAKTNQTAEIFGLASRPYTHLIESEPIIIKSGQTIQTKFRHQISWDFLQDFYFTEVFLRDGYHPQNFEFVVALQDTQDLPHFIPVFEYKPDIYQDEGTRVARWNFSPTKKFADHAQIFFSKSRYPTLEYPTENGSFVAKFYPEIPTKNFQKIFFLIDKSGKNYGERYTRIPKIIREILQEFPQEKPIGGAFFDQDETINFFEEEIFLPNMPQTHQKILEKFQSTPAVGKGDWSGFKSAFQKLNQIPEPDLIFAEDTAIMVMGSFDADFFPNQTGDHTAKGSFYLPKGNFFFLNFEEISGGNNEFLDYIDRTEKPLIKLFSRSENFLESKNFWRNWNAQKDPIAPDTVDFSQNTQEIRPSVTHRLQRPEYPRVFIGREPDKNPQFFSPQARFIVRLWEGYFNRKIIPKLFYGAANPDAKYSDHHPFFPHPEFPGLFMQYNFESLDDSSKTVLIKPFSEAQKHLFLTFPDIFSRIFSVDKFVAGCHQEHRCIVVDDRPHFRENPQDSDLLWWRNFHNDHWANPYLKKLTQKNILDISWDGNAEPDQKITRGSFVRMATKYFYPENSWKNFSQNLSEEEIFTDLSAGDHLTDKIQFLVSQKVIQGFPDQTFRPHEKLTRAQAVKILLAIKKVQPENIKIPQDLPFPDITGWEIPWVVEAQKRGMVQGFSDGRFWPHRSLTKGQAAKLIVEMK